MDAEAAFGYLHFVDENEPLDGDGLISDDNGSAISLQIDGGLEISGKEGELCKIKRREVLDEEDYDGDDQV